MTHKQLVVVFKKLPSDFEPWGKRSNNEHCGNDCASGCKWYHTLSGDVQGDWGICGNPNSPRVGLLTFEHQGCRQFEYGQLRDSRGRFIE